MAFNIFKLLKQQNLQKIIKKQQNDYKIILKNHLKLDFLIAFYVLNTKSVTIIFCIKIQLAVRQAGLSL